MPLQLVHPEQCPNYAPWISIRNDCSGANHHLFADLDAGKFVLLHFFMSSCSSCPPSAKRIQYMANNINAAHPGSVIGYAIPYEKCNHL
jgi:hypothetical protein